MTHHVDKDVLFFDGISAININHGVVKLILGSQEIDPADTTKQNNPVPSKVICMPLNVFIYAIAVFSKDPKNKEMIENMQKAYDDATKNKAN